MGLSHEVLLFVFCSLPDPMDTSANVRTWLVILLRSYVRLLLDFFLTIGSVERAISVLSFISLLLNSESRLLDSDKSSLYEINSSEELFHFPTLILRLCKASVKNNIQHQNMRR